MVEQKTRTDKQLLKCGHKAEASEKPTVKSFMKESEREM